LRGLGRPKKAAGIGEEIYGDTLATLEHTRAQVNLQFLADMEQAESETQYVMSEEQATNADQPAHSMQEILLTLGERIRSERQRTGLSQEGFARRLQVAPDGTVGVR
jgi:ribosome-binding protein aMBF1 (putative translation factor)